MSLPPIPPRPNTPQKFSTCILQLEESAEQAQNASSDNLGHTVSPHFYREQFPGTLSNGFDKQNLTKQINYPEKNEDVINTSLNNTYENTDSCLSNLPDSNSQELLMLQKSNYILIPTDPTFNTQKSLEYIYNKHSEKCIEEPCSEPDNKACISFCLNDYNLC
ncbi:hypothetical protein PCK2_000570 [Pneumocystis canis]|nr:hypothetical protein PCK2_000570 [Pneumocystis canis]